MWMSWSVFVISIAIAVYFVLRGMPLGAFIGVLGVLPPIIGAFRSHQATKDE